MMFGTLKPAVGAALKGPVIELPCTLLLVDLSQPPPATRGPTLPLIHELLNCALTNEAVHVTACQRCLHGHTYTGRFWPIRNARSMACRSLAGSGVSFIFIAVLEAHSMMGQR